MASLSNIGINPTICPEAPIKMLIFVVPYENPMRRYIIIMLMLLSTTMASAQTRELADSLIDYSLQYIGKPYRRAGNGPGAFDCSGFTRFVYKEAGMDLPHSSAEQGKIGRAVEGGLSALQKGDLVLYSGRANGSSIGHVGIFIELDPSEESFSFIHASTSNGVIISHSNEEYYSKRFRAVRRVLPDFEDEIVKDEGPDEREGQAVEADRLELSDEDVRIVMFGDGKWMIVDKDGTLRSPDTEAAITLTPDGRWSLPKKSSTMLPGATGQKTTQPSSQTTTGESGAEYYVIQSGDTLSKIAKKFGTSVAKICELNAMSQNATLRIGRRLRIR